jgi:hypothetical protein
MEELPFNLMDLAPKETTFTVSGCDKPLTLCKWSLRVRQWAKDKYGAEKLKAIFEMQDIDEIADIAWFMLKDDCKDIFKGDKANFLDAISSMRDNLSLIKALLAAIGIGEPEIEQINQALKDSGGPPDPNDQSPKT